MSVIRATVDVEAAAGLDTIEAADLAIVLRDLEPANRIRYIDDTYRLLPSCGSWQQRAAATAVLAGFIEVVVACVTHVHMESLDALAGNRVAQGFLVFPCRGFWGGPPGVRPHGFWLVTTTSLYLCVSSIPEPTEGAVVVTTRCSPLSTDTPTALARAEYRVTFRRATLAELTIVALATAEVS